ncbi:MAG: hypothetical protein DDT32_01262 [Syntrophomonadaceae bacterium]|nr:hypothetical protein [Bacillota bacterium]MBT9147505.1 hypothetical protein [Bacillota bacterium]
MAHINSWEIKKFIRMVLGIQIAILGVVGLAVLGYDVPLLRQFIGFIYLAFIPGLLLLRIFKLHKIGCVETLLYSVGLSIAFLMFTGFFMNMFYPLIGISKPISIFPVMATITFIVLILCAIAYKRESSAKESLPQNSPVQWSELLSPPALLLLLLPVLSALGAFLVYLHYGNVPLLILLSLIVLVVTLVAFGKFIPPKVYPLAVVAISISLVWHWTLVAPGLFGFDIDHEYYAQKLVLTNSLWDHTSYGNLNAMLSIVMLAPIYSLILNMDTVWIFKIIYPLFFSLVPLALFQAYRTQTDDKVAFFATFFFMSMPVFFSEMMQLARQQIAELFLGLSILLFLSKEMAMTKRATLLIIFALSIVVSHYGLSYIYMLYLLMALPLLFLWRSTTAKDLWERIAARFSKSRPGHSDQSEESRPFAIAQGDKINNPPRSTLTATYVMLFIVFCLAWYMYVTSGSTFSAIVRIGDHVYSGLITDFFLLEARDQHIVQALGLMPMRGGEVEWEIARIFQYVTQLFIVVGIVGLIASWRKTGFHPEYAALSLVSMVILAMCIILPYAASAINMSRAYHITLFFLSPFCILGGIATFRWLFRMLRLHRLRNDHTFLKLVVISVAVPYFLFTTGFIFELTGATPTSMPLSFHKADWHVLTTPEIRATKWLADKSQPSLTLFVSAIVDTF